MMKLPSRRRFLKWGLGSGTVSALVAGSQVPRLLKKSSDSKVITGSIVGPSRHVGHLLRTPSKFASENASPKKVKIAILGGGVSGLSAAWKLQKHGEVDFRIFDLEGVAGGNSRSGESPGGAHPWAAHYVPIPTHESKAVRELFTELGVIEKTDKDGNAVFNDLYLCFSPEERHYIHDSWHEGLFPKFGASDAEIDEYLRFTALMNDFKKKKDSDGKKAFAIPIALSSRAPEFTAFDNLTMKQYLEQNHFTTKRLYWYVNYACKDDYGASLDTVSAWAGIHYFASRDADEEHSVLTWPEGNGWLTQKLISGFPEKIQTHALVRKVRKIPHSEVLEIEIFDAEHNVSEIYHADKVIFALPHFTTPYILENFPDDRAALCRSLVYSPWLVANLTLSEPLPPNGFEEAWDNVLYESEGVGYVLPGHQLLDRKKEIYNLTYYHPFSSADVSGTRREFLEKDWSHWLKLILDELEKAHPKIREYTTTCDIMLWAHAMVRPVPGGVWSEKRFLAGQPWGQIYFAHSDLSAMSIFEEAQYHGVRAAEDILSSLGVSFESSIG